MENAEEEAHVRLGVLYYDCTLPTSWWVLIDESTNISYYWNDVVIIRQYARIQFKMSHLELVWALHHMCSTPLVVPQPTFAISIFSAEHADVTVSEFFCIGK